MKNITILLSILLGISISFIGCNTDENEIKTNSIMISEYSLASNSFQSVNENDIVLLQLEHPQSDADDSDLQNIGSDCYTFKPTKDIEANLLIEENMPISFIEIRNLQTFDFYSKTKDDDNSIYLFQKDISYEICVYHDGVAKHNQTLTMKFTNFEDENSSMTTMTTSCDFSQYDLSNCKFFPNSQHSTCDAITKENVSLPISFAYCNLNNANLSGTSIYIDTEYGNFNNIQVNEKTQFSLSGSSVIHMQVENVDLSIVEKFQLPDDIKGMSFKNSTLKNKIAFKTGATIEKVNFGNVDLSNVTMEDIKFINVDFSGTNLSQARLAESDFTQNVTLEKTNFKDSFLNNTKFSGTTLKDVNFSNATLDQADFSDSINQNTSFYNATLDGVNFNYSVLTNPTFENCKINASTSATNMQLKQIDIKQLSYLAKTNVNMSHTTQDTIKWTAYGNTSGYPFHTKWYEGTNTCSNCAWYEEHGHVGGGEDACCSDSKNWKDNYLCSKEDIGLFFNSAGQYHNDYVKLTEPHDKSWEDNWLSYKKSDGHNINFYWSSAGKIEKKICVNTNEPGDASNAWDDNYLCFDFD